MYAGLSIGVVMAAGALLALPGTAKAAEEAPDAAVVARSLVSMGDTARLQRVLAKARRGEKIVVGVVGGSITAGAKATKPEDRYGNRIAEWLRQSIPGAPIEFFNAGIGATGSNFGALRAPRDVLAHHPDLMVVEYAVNDPNNQDAAETLEGLVRQILGQPNQPAVVLLSMMHQGGGNAQEWLGKVGAHYALPMVSYRDALWPEIQAGRLKWDDVMADQVHPNDEGHRQAAAFVDALLGRVLKELPATPPAVRPLPAPLFTDRWEHVALLDGADLKPVKQDGWSYNEQRKWWQSAVPGSRLELAVRGEVISLMHWRIKGPMGRASVQVDDRPPITLEGWFDQTWGGYRVTQVLANDLPPGEHRVVITLLPEKNPQSDGNEFAIFGIGAAGVR